MFWITLISSIASIVSLLLAFVEYFQKWKKYLTHITTLTGGLALGIFLCMSEKTVQQFSQGELIYLVALVSILTFAIFFVYKFIYIGGETIGVSIIILGLIGYFSINLLKSVESSQSFIKPDDLIEISGYFASKKEYSKSADFLKKYREFKSSELDQQTINSIDEKIKALNTKSVDSIK